VTVSAGVAGYRAGESVSQLLHRADEALYEAKHAGRNRVVTKE
jgi:diguanylate cyclase (GGDEF)-like protein